jgi:Tfp pilus assembly protein PilP
MKTNYLLILFLALVSCQSNQDKTAEQEWIQLFNGEDLTG